MWNIDVADEHGCGQLQHDAAKGGTLDWQVACAQYSRTRGRGGRRARGGPGRASARPGWRPSMQCAKSTCRTPFWDRSMGAGCPAHLRVPPRVSQSFELYQPSQLRGILSHARRCGRQPECARISHLALAGAPSASEMHISAADNSVSRLSSVRHHGRAHSASVITGARSHGASFHQPHTTLKLFPHAPHFCQIAVR